jgi:hypothetical protein
MIYSLVLASILAYLLYQSPRKIRSPTAIAGACSFRRSHRPETRSPATQLPARDWPVLGPVAVVRSQGLVIGLPFFPVRQKVVPFNRRTLFILLDHLSPPQLSL